MPRAGLTADSVVTAAGVLADEHGLDGVTLARLAGRLGVRPPSLYAHVGGLADLRTRLAARGAEQLAAALQGAAAGLAGSEALSAVAHAYRAYALAHPGAYAALQRATGRTDQAAEAAGRVVAVVLAVLAGYGLEGEQALHATRAIRSALHGFVLLETQHGFGLPLDLDDSFTALVALLDSGLRDRTHGDRRRA
jgi:AcrR family transcriptional regulator